MQLKLLTLILFAAHADAEVLYEDFSDGLNPQRWSISSTVAPRDGPMNRSVFSPQHVLVRDGMLILKLTQDTNPDRSITSVGAELKTVVKLGPGVYEFEMRSSSSSTGETVSGSITGAGLYLATSETEIDVEMEGLKERADLTQTSTWIHEEKPYETARIAPEKGSASPYRAFHRYKIVWALKSVAFYRDGKLISMHKTVVPSQPAQFIFNHWGTNSGTWGGTATPGIDRYVYIRNFRYTPLEPA